MTDTAPAPSTSNGVPKLTSVDRVASIPVVNDSLARTHELLQANGLTARAYSLAENVVKTGYAYAVPVLGYGKPYIESADGLANKGLDLVESRFPYPFQTKTDQIVADVKKPADQAYSVARGIYDSRIAPLQGQPIVQKAVDSIYVINQQLSATVSGSRKIVGDLAGDTGAKLGALQHALVEELGKLQQSGSALPKLVQDNVVKSYHDLSTILLAKDKALSERSADVAKYVQETLQPVLDKVVEILKTTKEGAERKAGEVGGEVDKVQGVVEGKAKEGKAVAQDKAGKVQGKAKQAGQQAQDSASDAKARAADAGAGAKVQAVGAKDRAAERVHS